MAHACPDCGLLCHCGGDIDDILWSEGSPESESCSHFLTPDCFAYEDENDPFYPADDDEDHEEF